MLNRAFPDDPIVGEEDAADLRVESGKILRERIIELANETLTAELQPGEKEEWGVGPRHGRTAEELMDAIDRGNYNGGRTGREWFTFGFHPCLLPSPTLRRPFSVSLYAGNGPVESLTCGQHPIMGACPASQTFLCCEIIRP